MKARLKKKRIRRKKLEKLGIVKIKKEKPVKVDPQAVYNEVLEILK